MANIPSVAKRARQAVKRRERNASLRAELRTMKKNMQKLLDAGDTEGLKAKVPHALRLFDRMVSKGILHKNNAARSKSRLMKKVWALVPDFQLVSIKTQKPEKKAAPAKKKEAAAPAKATTAKKKTTPAKSKKVEKEAPAVEAAPVVEEAPAVEEAEAQQQEEASS